MNIMNKTVGESSFTSTSQEEPELAAKQCLLITAGTGLGHPFLTVTRGTQVLVLDKRKYVRVINASSYILFSEHKYVRVIDASSYVLFSTQVHVLLWRK